MCIEAFEKDLNQTKEVKSQQIIDISSNMWIKDYKRLQAQCTAHRSAAAPRAWACLNLKLATIEMCQLHSEATQCLRS